MVPSKVALLYIHSIYIVLKVVRYLTAIYFLAGDAEEILKKPNLSPHNVHVVGITLFTPSCE